MIAAVGMCEIVDADFRIMIVHYITCLLHHSSIICGAAMIAKSAVDTLILHYITCMLHHSLILRVAATLDPMTGHADGIK